MAKSPEEMADAMRANVEAKTGKPLAAWLALLKQSGLAKHGQMVKRLKGEHGMTHGFANLVAHDALQAVNPQVTDLVAAQYGGAKAGLRPIYDALLALVNGFGKDLEIAPKKAYVSLRRNKQFALIQPSTAKRVDVGINLKGTHPTGRLEASGSFNSMVSHRVRLASVDEVDDTLAQWLRSAYEMA